MRILTWAIDGWKTPAGKIISVILSIALVFSMSNVIAYAADAEVTTSTNNGANVVEVDDESTDNEKADESTKDNVEADDQGEEKADSKDEVVSEDKSTNGESETETVKDSTDATFVKSDKGSDDQGKEEADSEDEADSKDKAVSKAETVSKDVVNIGFSAANAIKKTVLRTSNVNAGISTLADEGNGSKISKSQPIEINMSVGDVKGASTATWSHSRACFHCDNVKDDANVFYWVYASGCDIDVSSANEEFDGNIVFLDYGKELYHALDGKNENKKFSAIRGKIQGNTPGYYEVDIPYTLIFDFPEEKGLVCPVSSCNATNNFSAKTYYDQHITPYQVTVNANYALKYDTNGGSKIASTTASVPRTEETLQVTNSEPKREGYTFLGWADYAEATEAQYAAGDEFTLNWESGSSVEKTLYAVWTPNTSVVTPAAVRYIVKYVDESGKELKPADMSRVDKIGETVSATAADKDPITKDGIVYSFDKEAANVLEKTLKNIVSAVDIVTLKLYFSADMIGENDPEKGDNIPDKYQVTFTYKAANGGKVEGTIKEVVTRVDENGNYSEIAAVSPKADVKAIANEGYWFVDWTDGPGSIPTADMLRVLTFDNDTEFTARFMKQNNLSYTVNYLEKGTDWKLADSKIVTDQTFGDKVTEHAIDIAGYIADRETKAIESLAVDGNEINFYYERNTAGFEAQGVKVMYDGDEHVATVLFSEDNPLLDSETIAWSEDGVEWFPVDQNDMKSRTDVGTTSVYLCVQSKLNGNKVWEANDPVKIIVTPRPIEIKVDDISMRYKEDVPEYTGRIKEGTLVDENDLGTISYKYDGTTEEAKLTVGTYEGVLIADYTENKNYDVKVVKGNLTVLPSRENSVNVSGVTTVYDGNEYSITASALIEGSQLEYSFDGIEWGTQNPTFMDAGTHEVYVRAKADNYEDTAVKTATVEIAPRPVTIKVDNASKVVGAKDPSFYGSVDGLVKDGDLGTITYSRTNKAQSVGTYIGVITANYEKNSNYKVSVEKGDFTITSTPLPPTPGTDEPTDNPGNNPVNNPTNNPNDNTNNNADNNPVNNPAPAADGAVPAAAAPVAVPAAAPAAPAAAPAAPAAPADGGAVIPDDANPLAAPTDEGTTDEMIIADDENPMGAFDDPECWVHILMIIGMIITVVYGGLVIARRLGQTNEIENIDKSISGSIRRREYAQKREQFQGA